MTETEDLLKHVVKIVEDSLKQVAINEARRSTSGVEKFSAKLFKGDSVSEIVGKKFDQISLNIKPVLQKAGAEVLEGYKTQFSLTDAEMQNLAANPEFQQKMAKAVIAEYMGDVTEAAHNKGKLVPNSRLQAFKNGDAAAIANFSSKMKQAALQALPEGFIEQKAVNLAQENPEKLAELMQSNPAMMTPSVIQAVVNDEKALQGALGNKTILNSMVASGTVTQLITQKPDLLKNPQVQDALLQDDGKLEQRIALIAQNPEAVSAILKDENARTKLATNPKAMMAVAEMAIASPALRAELLKHPQELMAIDKANPELAGALFDRKAQAMMPQIMSVVGNQIGQQVGSQLGDVVGNSDSGAQIGGALGVVAANSGMVVVPEQQEMLNAMRAKMIAQGLYGMLQVAEITDGLKPQLLISKVLDKNFVLPTMLQANATPDKAGGTVKPPTATALTTEPSAELSDVYAIVKQGGNNYIRGGADNAKAEAQVIAVAKTLGIEGIDKDGNGDLSKKEIIALQVELNKRGANPKLDEDGLIGPKTLEVMEKSLTAYKNSPDKTKAVEPSVNTVTTPQPENAVTAAPSAPKPERPRVVNTEVTPRIPNTVAMLAAVNQPAFDNYIDASNMQIQAFTKDCYINGVPTFNLGNPNQQVSMSGDDWMNLGGLNIDAPGKSNPDQFVSRPDFNNDVEKQIREGKFNPNGKEWKLSPDAVSQEQKDAQEAYAAVLEPSPGQIPNAKTGSIRSLGLGS